VFEAAYGSNLHHPYLFWFVGVPFAMLLAWRMRSARVLLPTLLVFQLGILLDAWLTAPKLSPLTGDTAQNVAIAFVVLGDARYFFLLQRYGENRPTLRALGIACALGLIVPIASLVAKVWSANPRVLFCVYEAMFAVLAVGLASFAVPRMPDGPSKRWAARLTTFEIVQYVLWVLADVIILSGHDVGYLLRLVPNTMYYAVFVPYAWGTAPKELAA
jgi:hypothetical protein